MCTVPFFVYTVIKNKGMKLQTIEQQLLFYVMKKREKKGKRCLRMKRNFEKRDHFCGQMIWHIAIESTIRKMSFVHIAK